MSKHTPGVWRIRPLRGKYYGTEIEVGDGLITVWTPNHYASPFASEREIAQGWEPEHGHDHVEDVQSYANAQLVAAAPSLLANIRELVEIAEAAIKAGDWRVDGCCDPTLTLDWCRATIAKATGEQYDPR